MQYNRLAHPVATEESKRVTHLVMPALVSTQSGGYQNQHFLSYVNRAVFQKPRQSEEV